MSVIAVYSMKGGVGKTTTAVNLAHLSARSGRPTLLIDLDPQGAASFYLRVKPKLKGKAGKLLSKKAAWAEQVQGTQFALLDVLPSDFSYRHLDVHIAGTSKPHKQLKGLLKAVDSSYLDIVIDCAPALSEVAEAVFAAVDVVVVPLVPSPLASRSLERVDAFLAKSVKKPPRRYAFFSMVDRRRKLHRELIAHHVSNTPGMLHITVPNNSQIERMGVERAPLLSFDQRGAGAKATIALWKELTDQIKHG